MLGDILCGQNPITKCYVREVRALCVLSAVLFFSFFFILREMSSLVKKCMAVERGRALCMRSGAANVLCGVPCVPLTCFSWQCISSRVGDRRFPHSRIHYFTLVSYPPLSVCDLKFFLYSSIAFLPNSLRPFHTFYLSVSPSVLSAANSHSTSWCLFSHVSPLAQHLSLSLCLDAVRVGPVSV